MSEIRCENMKQDSEEDENRQGGGGSPEKAISAKNSVNGTGSSPIPG